MGDKVVKLAKVYVRPHKRLTMHGLVDVEGHFREVSAIELLGGAIRETADGLRVSGFGHHWDIGRAPDSTSFEVYENDGVEIHEFETMDRALNHIAMKLRSVRQQRESLSPPEVTTIREEARRAGVNLPSQVRYPPAPGWRLGGGDTPGVTRRKVKNQRRYRRGFFNIGSHGGTLFSGETAVEKIVRLTGS